MHDSSSLSLTVQQPTSSIPTHSQPKSDQRHQQLPTSSTTGLDTILHSHHRQKGQQSEILLEQLPSSSSNQSVTNHPNLFKLPPQRTTPTTKSQSRSHPLVRDISSPDRKRHAVSKINNLQERDGPRPVPSIDLCNIESLNLVRSSSASSVSSLSFQNSSTQRRTVKPGSKRRTSNTTDFAGSKNPTRKTRSSFSTITSSALASGLPDTGSVSLNVPESLFVPEHVVDGELQRIQRLNSTGNPLDEIDHGIHQHTPYPELIDLSLPENDDDLEELVRCQNCLALVPPTNLLPHRLHCEKRVHYRPINHQSSSSLPSSNRDVRSNRVIGRGPPLFSQRPITGQHPTQIRDTQLPSQLFSTPSSSPVRRIKTGVITPPGSPYRKSVPLTRSLSSEIPSPVLHHTLRSPSNQPHHNQHSIFTRSVTNRQSGSIRLPPRSIFSSPLFRIGNSSSPDSSPSTRLNSSSYRSSPGYLEFPMGGEISSTRRSPSSTERDRSPIHSFSEDNTHSVNLSRTTSTSSTNLISSRARISSTPSQTSSHLSRSSSRSQTPAQEPESSFPSFISDTLYRCQTCNQLIQISDRDDHTLAHQLQDHEDSNNNRMEHAARRFFHHLLTPVSSTSSSSNGVGIQFTFGSNGGNQFTLTSGTRREAGDEEEMRFTEDPFYHIMRQLEGGQGFFSAIQQPPLPPPGTPQEIVNNLPTSEFNPRDKDHIARSDEETCMVCLDNYTNADQLRRLPCMHAFHVTCIDEWLQRSVLCPVCKVPVHPSLSFSSTQSSPTPESSRGGRGRARGRGRGY